MADDLQFREEVVRYVKREPRNRLTFSLLSGDRYTVEADDDIVLGKHVVSVFKRSSGHAFFPFYSICNVEVD